MSMSMAVGSVLILCNIEIFGLHFLSLDGKPSLCPEMLSTVFDYASSFWVMFGLEDGWACGWNYCILMITT